MYDDGNHNDGAAGDGNYGTSFVVSSGKMEYYVYAENNLAGIFSPARAEHEFISSSQISLKFLPAQFESMNSWPAMFLR